MPERLKASTYHLRVGSFLVALAVYSQVAVDAFRSLAAKGFKITPPFLRLPLPVFACDVDVSYRISVGKLSSL